MIKLRISEVAKEKKISMRKLAKGAGIAYNTLRLIYRNPFREISMHTLDSIAKVLGVPPGELLEGVPDDGSLPLSPSWRIPPNSNDVCLTLVVVKMFPDKVDLLNKKLTEIKQSGNHMFPGTIARYISESETFPGRVEIELVWRSADVPDEETRKQELAVFQQTLADVLN